LRSKLACERDDIAACLTYAARQLDHPRLAA